MRRTTVSNKGRNQVGRGAALVAALLLTISTAPMGLAGCGDDGAGGQGGAGGDSNTQENEGVVACRDACDTQLESCPKFDVEGCNDICDAYKITTDTDQCITLLAAWQRCEAGQTYTCAASPNEDVPIPDDPSACDAERDAYFNNPDC
ncbi:MAG: hypothetical protein U0271_05190 [Polyangiaceae bacterium]